MKRSLIGAAVLATGLFGAGVVFGQIGGISGSSAASAVSTPTTTQVAPSTGSTEPSFPAHGSAAHENTEKAMTGSAASNAQAAAIKYVGSGTAGAVTADFQGTGYEVTVTKSDGSTVDVHLDSGLNVEARHGGNDGPGADNTTSGPGA